MLRVLRLASGVEVDKVAEAFGKLTTDPTSGLMAMARQFRNVDGRADCVCAQLQRSGDEAGALQAANDAATKGFDEQDPSPERKHGGHWRPGRIKQGRHSNRCGMPFLDIGRPEVLSGYARQCTEAFDEADKKWQWYQSRSQRRRKNRLFSCEPSCDGMTGKMPVSGLAAATLQSDMEKAGELAARDRAERDASQLKYTGEAQKAYERLLTPLEKYTARQEELNKALKDGKNPAGRLQHADGGSEKRIMNRR